MTILNENLRPGDLAGVVGSVVSINEYVGKILKDSIVIGFYCASKQVAYDLNRFIQKSSCAILDCEVSDAPDMKGRYMVFVELQNNTSAPKQASILFAELLPLLSMEKWKLRTRINTSTVATSDVGDYFGSLVASGLNESMESHAFKMSPAGGIVLGETNMRVCDYGDIASMCGRLGVGMGTTVSYEQAMVVLEAEKYLSENVSIDATDKFIIAINETTGFAVALN